MSGSEPSDRAARLREAIRRKRQRRATGGAQAVELPPRPADAPARIGPFQRGLWLQQQLAPSSAAYNLASVWRCPGPLDADRLTAALRSVAARHRILRSVFRAGDEGEPEQIIADPSTLAVELVDARGGGDEALAAATAAARRPFDLRRGPLTRLLLVRASDQADEQLLVLALHHILADERSLGTVWRDLAAAYTDLEAFRGKPALPQFDDYLHWQRARGSARGGDATTAAADLDFWAERLTPPPVALTLPFARPAVPTAGPAAGPAAGPGGVQPGRLLVHRAAPGSGAAVQRLASIVGATPFAVYAFACRLLLQRYAGDHPFALATPATMRSHPATAGMVGYFLNPVVAPLAVAEDLTTAAAVRSFGAGLRELLGRGGVPFAELAERFAPAGRAPGQHPLFQAMFVHLQAAPAPRFGDVQLLPAPTLDLGEAKFDLTIFAHEDADAAGLELAVEYRVDRFDEIWMRRLLTHYETLLQGLTAPAAADSAVHTVEWLPAAERRALREQAEGEPLEDAEDPLPQQIARRCGEQPTAPAVVCGGEVTTLSQLERAARVLAADLVRRDVATGQRVAIFVERSPAMLVAVVGVHLAGAAYVPLDPEYPKERTRLVLEDADVAAVIVSARTADRLPPDHSATVVTLDELLDQVPDGATSAPPRLLDGDLAYLLFTSGSTGRPKGVSISHGNLRRSTAARNKVYGGPPGRFLLLPSIAFDSSVAGLFWALAGGSALVVPTTDELRDPRRLVALIESAAVRSLLCVPSLWARMLQVGHGRSLRGLDFVVVAGEACPPALVQAHFAALPGVRLWNEYGPTEATVWSTVHEVTPADAERSVPIGRPIPGVRIDVVDDRGRPVPAGVVGRGWIEGATVARGGYWRRPELTAERFATGADGRRRYRTGDLMSWTRDGLLQFHGREDEQVKLRGFRIEPGEIEAALMALPDVVEAAVVLRPGPGGEDGQLVAFVQRRGAAAGELPWREPLTRQLPAFMVPGQVVVTEALPRLPNGKVDRGALRARELATASATRGGGRPASAEEQLLAALWQGILGREGIGPDDNFFELGGHSLAVVEMTTAIERDFGVMVAPTDVFEHPTVRDLARRIRQQPVTARPYAHLFPIQPKGDADPLIFCVPHFFSGMVATRFRGERPVYGLRGISLRTEGNLGRWPTMMALAKDLVDEVLRRFPGRSLHLAGYSFGASMAAAMAPLLAARGVTVRRLWLIAPMPLDFVACGPLRLQLDGLREPVTELPGSALRAAWWRTNHPLTLRPYRRLWRRLGVTTWRRLLTLYGRIRRAFGQPLTPRILHADVRIDRFRLHSRFEPPPVAAPTTVFNATEPATDAAATWRPVFRGPFEVVATPDPHLDDEHIRAAIDVILARWEDLDG